MNEQQEWLSVEELASRLKVTPEAVRKSVADGRLPGARFGDELRVPASALDRCARRAERGAVARRWWRRGLLLAGVATAALAAVIAIAASPPNPGEVVPRQIPYRGYLDQNGVPVTNTAMAMVFELFTVDTGGIAAWTETQPAVSVQDGQFTVALGDVVPIPPNLFSQPSLYLQISIDGQLLSGRQRLLTVPYSHAADSATLVRGQDITTSLVPAGTVVAFAGSTPPAGWTLCNGIALSRTDYPALFAAIGTAWGAPDSSHFRVPDLRGQFLRGVSAGAGVDPDAAARYAGYPGGNAGDLVGAYQADATAPNSLTVAANGTHTHNSGTTTLYAFPVAGCGTTSAGADCTAGEASIFSPIAIPAAGSHVHALSGDAETRPTNAGVNWIIKL